MAIYYHEEQKFLYDSETKIYISLNTRTKKRYTYERSDVGHYSFYKRTITEIVTLEDRDPEIILPSYSKAIEIDSSRKAQILAEWESLVSQKEEYLGTHAADDGGEAMAQDIRNDNMY